LRFQSDQVGNVEGRANGGLNRSNLATGDVQRSDTQFLPIISVYFPGQDSYSHASAADLLGSRVVVHGDLIDEDFVQSKFSARRGVAESDNEADAGSRRLNVRNF
jgi:hypothetical protein